MSRWLAFADAKSRSDCKIRIPRSKNLSRRLEKPPHMRFLGDRRTESTAGNSGLQFRDLSFDNLRFYFPEKYFARAEEMAIGKAQAAGLVPSPVPVRARSVKHSPKSLG
jgi:hypothetical protein